MTEPHLEMKKEMLWFDMDIPDRMKCTMKKRTDWTKMEFWNSNTQLQLM